MGIKEVVGGIFTVVGIRDFWWKLSRMSLSPQGDYNNVLDAIREFMKLCEKNYDSVTLIKTKRGFELWTNIN